MFRIKMAGTAADLANTKKIFALENMRIYYQIIDDDTCLLFC